MTHNIHMGSRKTQPSESESQTTELDTCDSNISTEPSELVSEPVVNESNVEVQPKDNPHRTLKNKGIIDSGCSRHMTGNKAYLADFQDFNGGPVAFGGSKGYITGKGKIKTGKLDFEDVSFVKELQPFNLFSVSQMCDKKNKVLFTDTEWMLLNSGLKGIKREYNNAINPQQKGVAEKNQANLHAGQQESNQNTGTKTKIDAGDSEKEDESNQDCFELPIWHSSSSTIHWLKSIIMIGGPREGRDKVFLDRSCKTSKARKREANEEAEALRKNLEQETEHIVYSGSGAAKSSSTNIFSTVSTTAKASGTNLVNTVSMPVNTASANEGLSITDTTNSQEDDSEIPPHEDIHEYTTDGKRRIDYDEVFAPVARLEAIRIFLAFASYMGFIVYQMDVKSAFLYGKIDEEVYVSQPPGFLDPKYPEKVYKVVKALYGLHQAPRAWYATLSTFLLKNGYKRGTIDKTLFLKKDKHDIILVQVYVDDIIFGSTKKSWCDEFEALMKSRFQMSSMGELTFFLGLQVKQKPNGIFISQDKYVAEILKKFDFASVKTASTPIETQKPLVKDEEASDVDVHLYRSMIGSLMYVTASRPDIMFAVCACSRFQVTPKTSHLSAVKRIFRYLKGKPKLGLWYPRDSSFDLESYSDSDYAGANLDRKSTTGGCQFLGRRLITWQCKKQTIVATSTTEAEYVAAASCCGQNPVTSKTKHIAIRHHFIRDAYEKKLIQLEVMLVNTLRRFRESLRRVTDGAEAFLILTLFILSLDKVSTDHAKLVPLGKVTKTYKNPFQSHTYSSNLSNCHSSLQALISLTDDHSLLSKMAALESCPKHNMIAYLEKTEGNVEFHEVIDFLRRSYIYHALTVSPIVSTTFVEQFWTSAKSKTINNVRHITAKVAGKLVSIS
ncbi:putative ribonuclease H-like domain-containing protein [Tanacetum coccineum]